MALFIFKGAGTSHYKYLHVSKKMGEVGRQAVMKKMETERGGNFF